MDWEVQLSEHGGDFGLEEGQASLVAFESLGVSP